MNNFDKLFERMMLEHNYNTSVNEGLWSDLKASAKRGYAQGKQERLEQEAKELDIQKQKQLDFYINMLRDLKRKLNNITTQARRWDAAIKLNKKSQIYGELRPEINEIFKKIREINKLYPSELSTHNESIMMDEYETLVEMIELYEGLFDNISAVFSAGKKVGKDIAQDAAKVITDKYSKVKKYTDEKKQEFIKQYNISKADSELKQINSELDDIYKDVTELVSRYKKLTNKSHKI